MKFEIVHRDRKTKAKVGRVITAHGVVDTPAFIPVGTHACVKTMAPEELKNIGTQIILSNTYHLYLRPGREIIKKAGGLHNFMHWDGPLLTDSGGYQIFSLSSLTKVTEEGVRFRSHLDNSRHFLTPEDAISLQNDLGADIIMALDECTTYPCEYDKAKESMELTLKWARRCQLAHRRSSRQGGTDRPPQRGETSPSAGQALFGIVQGSTYKDLREECALRLVEMDFPGYALGGLSVGEEKELTYEVLDYTLPLIPANKPCHIMGIGPPEDLIEGVIRGGDLFDCAMITRNARNGQVFTSRGRLNILNASHTFNFHPLDADCECYVCGNFSRAYLRHLFKAKEILAYRLFTYHNLYFILKLMKDMREAILKDGLLEFKKKFMRKYKGGAK